VNLQGDSRAASRVAALSASLVQVAAGTNQRLGLSHLAQRCGNLLSKLDQLLGNLANTRALGLLDRLASTRTAATTLALGVSVFASQPQTRNKQQKKLLGSEANTSATR
jgi:hypothetical protein